MFLGLLGGTQTGAAEIGRSAMAPSNREADLAQQRHGRGAVNGTVQRLLDHEGSDVRGQALFAMTGAR